MCKDCKEITIPIGPKGDPGPAGANGTNGTNGSNGTNGTNGINGTNAFKFVKEFTTNDIEQQLTITQSELTSCNILPEGCLHNDILQDILTDFHVKVYFKAINHWIEMTPVPFSGSTITAGAYTYRLILVHNIVSNPTANIYIQLDNSFGTYRVVILG